MAFKMKSGMKPSFKMMGASPYKKPLVGDQHKLPEHLQQKILDSPAKQKIVGEDTSEIKKDAKGKDYSLALYDTESGVMKGDTIRPGNAPRVGDYIMGGDYELEKLGDKNYKIKSPAKQKEAAKIAGKAALEGVKKKEGAKVAGKAALEGVKKLAPKAVEKEIGKMLGGGASDSEIRKYVKSTGTGDKYEYNWDNVTQRVESHPLKQKNEGAVFHERIAKHVMTKDGLVPNPLLEKLKDRPQAKGYTPKSQSNDGYAYQDGVRVENKKSPAKQKMEKIESKKAGRVHTSRESAEAREDQKSYDRGELFTWSGRPKTLTDKEDIAATKRERDKVKTVKKSPAKQKKDGFNIHTEPTNDRITRPSRAIGDPIAINPRKRGKKDGKKAIDTLGKKVGDTSRRKGK